MTNPSVRLGRNRTCSRRSTCLETGLRIRNGALFPEPGVSSSHGCVILQASDLARFRRRVLLREWSVPHCRNGARRGGCYASGLRVHAFLEERNALRFRSGRFLKERGVLWFRGAVLPEAPDAPPFRSRGFPAVRDLSGLRDDVTPEECAACTLRSRLPPETGPASARRRMRVHASARQPRVPQMQGARCRADAGILDVCRGGPASATRQMRGYRLSRGYGCSSTR